MTHAQEPDRFFFALDQAKTEQLRLMRKRPMGERERQIRRVDRNRQIRRSTTQTGRIQTNHAEPSDGSFAHEPEPPDGSLALAQWSFALDRSDGTADLLLRKQCAICNGRPDGDQNGPISACVQLSCGLAVCNLHREARW